jgi:hypothetical protein
MLLSKIIAIREEYSMRISKEEVLGRIFGTKREEVREEWRNYIMRSFIISNLHYRSA